MQKNKMKQLMFLLPIVFFALSFFCINFAFSFSSFASTEQTSSSTTAEGELGAEYFLYDTSFINFPENPSGLTANIENQKQSDLCWAFSSITALETTLYKSGLVGEGETLNFSELDLAYNVFVTSRLWDTLGGGAFEVAYEYFSSDSGPVDEQSWETANNTVWTSSSNEQLVDFYSTGLTTNERILSGYSSLESYFFKSADAIKIEGVTNGVSESVTTENILANRNSIKNHIQTYGGATASMYYNNTYLANDIYYYCYNSTQSANHMVTLVGWDDNITISGHTGAYIAQNSYGESFGNGGFFYISYDDEYVENNVCGFTRVDESLTDYIEYNNMSSSLYENQFVTFDSSHTVYYTSYYSYSSTVYSANIYTVDSSYANQYLSRIKIPTMCVETFSEGSEDPQNYDATTFKVYVLNGLTSNGQTDLNSNFADKIPVVNSSVPSGDEYLFSANQTGYYTIEVEDDIRLTGDYFAIIFEVDDGILYYMTNNPDQNISDATYVSQQPTTSWTVYGASQEETNECVLPMIIQTKYDLNNMTYEVTGGTFTYDGLSHNPTVSVTTPSTFDITYSLDGTTYSSTLPNIKNVKIVDGSVSFYTVYVKIEADYYNTVVEQVEIRINPKNLFITPMAVSIIYGGTYVAPTWALSGLVSGESLNYTGRISVQNFATSGLNNVGEYDIVQNTLLLSSKNTFLVTNYAVSFVSGIKYEVTPKTLEIVPDELEKFYGDSDPVFTYHFSGAEGSQTPNVLAILERITGENVGEYALTMSGNATTSDDTESGFYAENYNTVFTTDIYNFTIIPRILTITPNSTQSKIYGEDDPTLTFTSSNTISGEPPAFLGSLSRISGEDAGNYQITLGSLATADNSPFLAENYALEIFSTTIYFTIYSGTINDSFVTDISDSYNGEEHFVVPTSGEEYTVRYSEVSSKTDAFNEGTASTQNIGKTNSGSYYICFEFLKENYVPKYETAKITISPISLIVTPNANQSKIYGESDDISFGYSGQISGQTPAFSGNLSRIAGENVGEYLITEGTLTLADNGNFLESNYTLNFENSDEITYEITKRTLNVIPNDTGSKLYGKNDPVLTYTSSGYVFSDAEDFSGLLSRESGENVGDYAINIGSLSLASTLSANYNFVLDGTTHFFEISPVGVKIKIINLEDEYGNLLLNYYGETTFDTVSYEFEDGTEVNFVSGDSLELEYFCKDAEGTIISPENLNTTFAGNYSITAESQNENYTLSVNVESTYTITYRNYLVTFIIEESALTRTKNVTHFDQVGTLPDGVVATPTISGYTFINWQKSTDDVNWTTVEDLEIEEIVGNTKFKANLELNSYRIYYNLNGGSLSGTVRTSFNVNTDTFFLSSPSKLGYTFMGYFENADFSGDQVTQIAKGTARDFTLYARWQIISYAVSQPASNALWTLTASSGTTSVDFGSDYIFDINISSAYNKSYATIKVIVIWGSSSEQEEITPQQITDIDSDGVKNRYTISNVTDDFEITVSDVTLNVYSISFVADGLVVSTINLTHGASLLRENFPDIPAKENYDETAPVWSVTTNITNATQDLEISAIYTPNVYVVTFLMADGNEFTVQTTYGTAVDTSVLEDEYKLNMFEYFVFAKSLSGISSDETIRVEIASNIHIFYIVLASAFALIVLSVVISIIKKKHRHQARSSAYNKLNREEYQANLEKFRNEKGNMNKNDNKDKK